jgi:hypothetical protein
LDERFANVDQSIQRSARRFNVDLEEYKEVLEPMAALALCLNDKSMTEIAKEEQIGHPETFVALIRRLVNAKKDDEDLDSDPKKPKWVPLATQKRRDGRGRIGNTVGRRITDTLNDDIANVHPEFREYLLRVFHTGTRFYFHQDDEHWDYGDVFPYAEI